MKNIFRILAVSLALTVGSCNFIDYDLNVDPNNPLDVSMNLLLPQAQVSIAYVFGGDFGRYAHCWTQHTAGVERQHAGIEVYLLKEDDVNNAWSTLYSGALMDMSRIVEKAEETDSPHFRGIARIMTAMTMGTLVDLFNDVPYSEALQGADNLKPKFDDAATVYNDIQNLLRDGIVDMQAPASTFLPGTSDLMYGGNTARWIALARTLQARYYLHLSEIDAGAYSNALGALDAGAIAENAGNAQVVFGTAATAQNPWYQFNTQRADVVMGKYFIDLLLAINDPRLPLFAVVAQDGTYRGASAGVPDATASRHGSALCGAASPVVFSTYAEAKFIEAEAALPTNKQRAADAYNAALAASLGQFGLTDAAWLAQESADAGSITLEKILTHKYIAMYTSLETFVDIRRKGIPALTPVPDESQLPSRFPYPQSERVYNAQNWAPYSGITVFGKVFWDN